ncbi:MAG: histidine kinase [Acidobacteriota bacterium]|nr:histidine kinase [Acidobacteriota bacterium]
MPKTSPADELARKCAALYTELRRASGLLHDEVGALLAVAGLRLQLLSMDFPEAGARVAEVAEALDGAMEQVRKLSRQLEPTPVRRTGLKNALLELAREFPGVTLRHTATAVLAPVAVDALYRAIASAVAAAVAASAAPEGTGIAISVTGSRSVTARIVWNGGFRAVGKDLAAAALLARHSGMSFEIAANPEKNRQHKTIQGTIVVIQYAGRRSAGG